MMNASPWDSSGYATVETLLEEVSNHIASSNMSRCSRNTNTQPKAAGSMRIVKPNSNSNSPRNSVNLGRRRTVTTDGAYRKRLAMLDQNTLVSQEYHSNKGLQQPTLATRPVSWHPASQVTPQRSQIPYAVPTSNMNSHFHMYDFPPTPAAYSGYASPASTFSPVSMPYSGYEQQYQHHDVSASYPNPSCNVDQQPQAQYFNLHPPTDSDPSMYSHFDWSNFANNGFENSTTPPTPENFLPIQHPEPIFPAEEAIPYHPLSDDDDTGEELIGMGLYDNPEAAKHPASDPYLENYRALMMSQLLGSNYKRPEPVGKGLKLEETWSPPASDDEEDDREQDGEGEDDEQCTEEVTSDVSIGSDSNVVKQNYIQSGWV